MRVATDKEKEMCLHKFCLNVRLKFNALMDHIRKHDGQVFTSITSFFTHGSPCEKDTVLDYFSQQCCLGTCQLCKNLPLPTVPNNNDSISFYQFEVVKEMRISKKTKQLKEFTRTERVSHADTVNNVLLQILALKKKYLYHQYQIRNDKINWKTVLSTVDQGDIFWCDYSENLQGTPKFEPQDSHFSKKQYSLHCTVDYDREGTQYHYHLSDDRNHDSIFTSEVLFHLISTHDIGNWMAIRFKMDNCSTQYKSRKVFPTYVKLASVTRKTVLVYFGVSGHGKGLVDAMSGFGVKQPLRLAIIQQDIFFQSADEIHKYLKREMSSKPERHYHLLRDDLLEEKRKLDRIELKIAGCQKQHMFAFFPNGQILMKENLCSCRTCLLGQFIDCKVEKGIVVVDSPAHDSDDTDSEYDSDAEFAIDNNDDDEDEDFIDDRDTLLSEVSIGATAAIFSAENNEPFYLIQILDKKVADETVVDDYNHTFNVGESYIVAHYMEKVSEHLKKGFVQYKMLTATAFVRPSQVFYPCVKIGQDNKLAYEEYNFLSDCTFIKR